MKKILLPLLLLLLLPTSASAEKRIVGGETARPQEWRSTVSLGFRTNAEGRKLPSSYWGHFCTGTLLTPRIVLTAGHCVLRGPGYEDVDVTIGRPNLLRVGQGEKIPAIMDWFHPREDSNSDGRDDWGADIALVRLSRPSRTGKPLGIGRIGSPRTGAVQVAGWGYTASERPATLQTAFLERGSDSLCQALYPRGEFVFIPQYQFCAGNPGVDACNGDSGGPVMQNGRLVGLVSFGPVRCGETPGVYLRTDRFRKWIRRTARLLTRDYSDTRKKPVRENSGWAPQKNIGFGWYGTALVGNTMDKYVHIFSLESNYPVHGATVSVEAPFVLCPGRPYEYPVEGGTTVSDERCSSTISLGTLPGGRTEPWEGWNPTNSGNLCPTIRIEATIGGQPWQRTLRSCEVPPMS